MVMSAAVVAEIDALLEQIDRWTRQGIDNSAILFGVVIRLGQIRVKFEKGGDTIE